MLYQKILLQKEKLLKEIERLEQKLTCFPEGHLTCITNGKYIKNMHVHDGIRTHIPGPGAAVFGPFTLLLYFFDPICRPKPKYSMSLWTFYSNIAPSNPKLPP